MRQIPLLLLLFLLHPALNAQIPNDNGELSYGDEWINYEASYLKLTLAEDGLYRISPDQLSLAGFNLSADNTDKWQLWHQGVEVPLLVTSTGLYFFGEANDGALDRHLYANPDRDQLNPSYSMYNDTAAYYLGLSQVPPPEGAARFTTINGAPTPGSPSVPYVWREAKQVYSDFQNKIFIRTQGISIYYSHYDQVEGYGSRSINDLLSFNGSTESSFTLDLDGLVTAGPMATITARFGLGFDSHQQSLVVEGNELSSLASNGWGVWELSGDFTPTNALVNGSLSGSGGERDKASLASIQARYPASTNFSSLANGVPFQLDASLEERQLNSLTAPSWLFNLGQQTFQAVADGSFNIPAQNALNDYFIIAESGNFLTATSSLYTPVDSRPQIDIDYLIISSERLRAAENGADHVAEYAAYRSSPTGGNFNVQVVNVEDLYDTYAYGVDRHPLAIRNFQASLRTTSPSLKYLFLIGKGREYTKLRTATDLAAAESSFFLPSFGFPASDNLISAPLDGVVPALATGRLSVINAEEVRIYLDKVEAFEAQRDNEQSLAGRDWMKQIIHLGGGGVPGEQQSIRNLLTNMENEIENSAFGASVTSFYKTSSDPIEESRQEAIFNRINAGTSVITFFGHSSSQGFDFSIDNPQNYFNTGKYPLMLSLGCYSGDAFTAERSIGERFVLFPEKGAIAFGASKGLGYISALGIFARGYYDLLGGEYYGQGLGDVLQQNIANFQTNTSFSMRILTEQFALNGDPSLRLNPHPGPDLVIDPSSVAFEPRVIPAQQDSFLVKMRMVNLGRGTTDSLNLLIQQQLPSGEIQDLRSVRMRVPPYAHELELQLPNQGFDAIGVNTLLAKVDTENEVSEMPAPFAEQNNELATTQRVGVPFFVVANTARPAFPPPYALHQGSNTPELIASTTNPLAEVQRYFLEIDTSQLFENPLASTEITQAGGLLRWQPNLGYQDSTVYYWRISPDSVNTQGSGLLWNSSSFTYLDNNEQSGWAQAHQGQFNDGKFINIGSSSNDQDWNFTRSFNDVRIRNKVYDPVDEPSWEFNGQPFGSPWPWVTQAGVQLIVIDSINNVNWTSSPGDGSYGSLTHSGTRSPWSFNTRTAAGRAGLMQFIQEGIPDGKYVTLYTAQRGNNIDYGIGDWLSDSTSVGRTIFGILEDQGALQSRQLINLGSVPYVFVFQKGVGPIAEQVASDQNTVADVLFSIGFNWPDGKWSSDLIGPGNNWEQLELSFLPGDISTADSVVLELFGYTSSAATGESILLEELALSASLDFSFDLSALAIEDYSYLGISISLFDEPERSAPTLSNAYIHYQRAPDVAIAPTINYQTSADSLEQGQELTISIGYQNISNTPMDSLLVAMDISSTGTETQTQYQRMPPLNSGESGVVSFNAPSEQLSGDAQLQLRLNPDEDQPEEIRFNNDLVQEFYFEQDIIDPVLSVFFDGVAIRDGDLVSARPEILLQLRDENRFLLLNDTSLFTLSLRFPDGSAELIPFSDERIEFNGASSGTDNEANIYFRPELTQDGQYELAVQAVDRSGNTSGRLDLIREFEVITEQRVANVFNYPNPFSTATQFVYTLTGDQPPATFRIQIMTVSGRVVRDIDLTAEEELKIGTHRTNYTWDGTDEYGDQLANGVYLYRVITRDDNGLELEHHDTGTDQFFLNKMGKLVILR